MKHTPFILMLGLGLLAVGVPAPRAQSHQTIRGITISTHTDGRDWAGDAMEPTMRDIRGLGANWVAIHPYAGIRADGTVRWRDMHPDEAPEWIARPILEAHAAGMKILIKPHLAYWGSSFSWRGEITFQTPEEWARFWEEYTEWIVAVARASRGADALAVGTELDLTLGHETEWRTLIARVREVSSMPLTYAANWTHYQDVSFWDALDAIGIQAYFPITEAPLPTRQALALGWAARMQELRTYSEAQNRWVVFTELGYNRSFSAAARPWEYHTDGEEAEAMQRLCLEVALEAIEEEPRVLGSFLWKWFPTPRSVGRNFQLATPGIRSTIADVWRR